MAPLCCKAEKGNWTPLEPKGDDEKIEELSPFYHIRVFIVLKNVDDGIYPVSLQLLRTDGLNIKGPVYKDIARKLGEDLLPGEEKELVVSDSIYSTYPDLQPGDTILVKVPGQRVELSQQQIS